MVGVGHALEGLLKDAKLLSSHGAQDITKVMGY